MKNILILIGFAGAGFVGALGAIALRPAPEAPLAAPASNGFEDRLARVETSLARLSDEVRGLRMVPLPEPAEAPAGAAVEPTGAAPADADATVDAAIPEEELREKVLDVLEEREKAEREERAKRWAEREASMLDRLETDLGLNAYQREELGKILEQRRAAMDDMRRLMEEGGTGDRDAVRRKFREVRESTAEQIKALLTPEQYEAFTRQDRGGPDRGGRGGRGPGGRGR